jgi:hypothetical protein
MCDRILNRLREKAKILGGVDEQHCAEIVEIEKLLVDTGIGIKAEIELSGGRVDADGENETCTFLSYGRGDGRKKWGLYVREKTFRRVLDDPDPNGKVFVRGGLISQTPYIDVLCASRVVRGCVLSKIGELLEEIERRADKLISSCEYAVQSVSP